MKLIYALFLLTILLKCALTAPTDFDDDTPDYTERTASPDEHHRHHDDKHNPLPRLFRIPSIPRKATKIKMAMNWREKWRYIRKLLILI